MKVPFAERFASIWTSSVKLVLIKSIINEDFQCCNVFIGMLQSTIPQESEELIIILFRAKIKNIILSITIY